MARAISKSGFTTTVYAYVIREDVKELTTTINDTEVVYTDVFQMNGKKSFNAAQIQCEKRFGKNSMVVELAFTENAKLSLSAESFFMNSEPCTDGATYGHDVVTSEFKITAVEVMYRDGAGMHNDVLTYFGTTTQSKLLNYAREQTGSKMCVVKAARVLKTRRYMSREKYDELARAEMREREEVAEG